ncbi:TM0026 family membrane protein [Pseudothermotoga sp. U03pept]|uniref:TM0026 family membrane protein n=1 Tax=Pseudothermotoga sp. U03pept TaxID=3447012 RepID=UPI003EFF24B7
MFVRSLLVIFAWALVLEFLVLTYYIWRGTKPVEFYINLGLMAFTVFFLIFFILRERKRRDEDDKRR